MYLIKTSLSTLMNNGVVTVRFDVLDLSLSNGYVIQSLCSFEQAYSW